MGPDGLRYEIVRAGVYQNTANHYICGRAINEADEAQAIVSGTTVKKLAAQMHAMARLNRETPNAVERGTGPGGNDTALPETSPPSHIVKQYVGQFTWEGASDRSTPAI